MPMTGVVIYDACDCGSQKDSRAKRCARCAYDPIVRFWRYVEKTETCWVWTGPRHRQGYGRFRVAFTKVLAHRFAYEMFVGPIPEGLTIDHLCFNQSCVNPEHLEAVTQGENMRRWREKVRTKGRLLFGKVAA